jgi:hypothetical protein
MFFCWIFLFRSYVTQICSVIYAIHVSLIDFCIFSEDMTGPGCNLRLLTFLWWFATADVTAAWEDNHGEAELPEVTMSDDIQLPAAEAEIMTMEDVNKKAELTEAFYVADVDLEGNVRPAETTVEPQGRAMPEEARESWLEWIINCMQSFRQEGL